jgi:hypothetical protein
MQVGYSNKVHGMEKILGRKQGVKQGGKESRGNFDFDVELGIEAVGDMPGRGRNLQISSMESSMWFPLLGLLLTSHATIPTQAPEKEGTVAGASTSKKSIGGSALLAEVCHESSREFLTAQMVVFSSSMNPPPTNLSRIKADKVCKMLRDGNCIERACRTDRMGYSGVRTEIFQKINHLSVT